jgi:type I restriction enzyme S subunit
MTKINGVVQLNEAGHGALVAEVDELMALCDRIEGSLTDTAVTRRSLLDALTAKAIEPVDARGVEAVA